jgi:alpha-glucuronidase
LVVSEWSRETTIILFVLGLLVCRSALAQRPIIREGKAMAVIVVQKGAGIALSLAASELQKYIGALTGMRLEIIDPSAVAQQARDQVLLLVGGLEANPLVQKAVAAGQIDFRGLNPEGFLLRTVEVEGRPALVIGSNDEA